MPRPGLRKASAPATHLTPKPRVDGRLVSSVLVFLFIFVLVFVTLFAAATGFRFCVGRTGRTTAAATATLLARTVQVRLVLPSSAITVLIAVLVLVLVSRLVRVRFE